MSLYAYIYTFMQVKIILVHQKSKINFHIINFSNIGEAILNFLAGITKKDKNIDLGKPQVWFEELIFYQLESQNKKTQVQQNLRFSKSLGLAKPQVQQNPMFSKTLGFAKPHIQHGFISLNHKKIKQAILDFSQNKDKNQQNPRCGLRN